MNAPAAPEPVPGPPAGDGSAGERHDEVVRAWAAAVAAGVLLVGAVLVAVWVSVFFAVALGVLAVFAAVDASSRIRRAGPGRTDH